MMTVCFTEHPAPNQYFDKHFKMNAVKILPGEFFATQNNTLIVTVLGSCVSVCLRDSITQISGMNHFLLPVNTDIDISSSSGRYGVNAMEMLINQMIKLGAPKHRLEAKVFGGGNVMKQFRMNSIGEQNSAFVLAYLKKENIPISASDLLGEYPRKVYFFPQTGEVKVKRLISQNNTTILDRESEYRIRVNRHSVAGDIDFF